MPYESIIGLEIHAQLKTKSKMFCSSINNSDENKPNKNVCPVCMGHPGVLPVINKEAVEWTIMIALALNCKIPSFSKFDRKNYFYPDLPKGYQISQFDAPLGIKGFLEIEVDGEKRKIAISRVHLEEDAAKLIHPKGGNYSLIDYNRAGTPLVEIVTEPDIKSPKEAKIFMQELRKLLRYLDVSDADMEKGQLRCDANISLRPEGSNKLFPKTEVKNMNSFRAVERALTFETERQLGILKNGKSIAKETTRGWIDDEGVTVEQRFKEEACDYRYFPEPDLPPLEFSDKKIKELRDRLPELPWIKQKRYMKQFGLESQEAKFLVYDRKIAEFFEYSISEAKDWLKSKKAKGAVGGKENKELIKLAYNWIKRNLFSLLKEYKIEMQDCKITPENFGEFLAMINRKEIGSAAAQIIFQEMFKRGADPSHIVEEKDLKQLNSEKELVNIVDDAIKNNAKPVADFQKGKEQALKFLVGQVMVKTKGKANPKIAERILKEKLQK